MKLVRHRAVKSVINPGRRFEIARARQDNLIAVTTNICMSRRLTGKSLRSPMIRALEVSMLPTIDESNIVRGTAWVRDPDVGAMGRYLS